MQHAAALQTSASNLPAPGADPGVKLVDLALLAELQDDEAVAALADHVVGVARSRRPVHHEA